MGEALTTVADELNDTGDAKTKDARREIVLVGDLQQGSRLTALQAYEWPKDVRVSVRPVALAEATNAGLHFAGAAGDRSAGATPSGAPNSLSNQSANPSGPEGSDRLRSSVMRTPPKRSTPS